MRGERVILLSDARGLVVPEGDSPRDAEAHLDGIARLCRVADGSVEGKPVAHLPDRSRERGVRGAVAELMLRVDLGDGPEGPVTRAFQDEAD